ncbi:MAG: 2-succinyl-5-enolpyruvyl-6-hydroxy-3-cyclohexene-1-carboxylic-acid synthase, partial [Bacteroidaceae bacterium]|nr:2-succinyl-5-enolpyruvyl-6-hydroxy-3-cyclohexene-1-carboxylic-acid synthase [Bacteroidaceae bacterium]
LVLANSSSVRLAQLASNNPCENTLCNRGINGIEGTLSTAVGYAMVMTSQPVFVVIGDLAFFYDQNALWQKALPSNLHILLFNDGGGSIFNTLPLPSETPLSIEAITGKHTLSAKHVANLHGIRHMQGKENLEEFINSQETSILEII